MKEENQSQFQKEVTQRLLINKNVGKQKGEFQNSPKVNLINILMKNSDHVHIELPDKLKKNWRLKSSFIGNKSNDVIYFALKAYEQKIKGTKGEKSVISETSLLFQNRKEFLDHLKILYQWFIISFWCIVITY